MKTFLEYVADDLIAKYSTDMSRLVLVFPNKRAALYIREYLAKAVGRPMWSPECTTVSELLRRHSHYVAADRIKLICILHRSFCRYTQSDETLDQFYGWGEMILSDFDDIDKDLADATQIFSNISGLHEQDRDPGLTDEQREALSEFFHVIIDGDDSALRQRFRAIWDHLGEIYLDFNAQLRKEGIAYEGAIYRDVATNTDADFGDRHYAFVGFNALRRAERTVFSRLKKEGKALFYWDYDQYYMPQKGKNENVGAGIFIGRHLANFPNELEAAADVLYSNFRKPKRIRLVSAMTENIQARYVATWLDDDKIRAGRNTAIVMCDESLLQPVVSSLPGEAGAINVTAGYPLRSTSTASLVAHLLELQSEGTKKRSGRYSLQHVRRVVDNPLMRYYSDATDALRKEIDKAGSYYPDSAVLTRYEGYDIVFGMLQSDGKKGANDDTAEADNAAILRWLKAILERTARRMGNAGDDVEREGLFRMYTIVARVQSLVDDGLLNVATITLRRLIRQIVESTTIPFHGEPITGIQVMGMLETRNLDFDNVLLLSCNEGNMPKGINDASFIPYPIRKAFDLPTADDKAAVYAYYFYRLLQRAGDITIVYNSSTNNGHKGEMSRFALQLLVYGGHKVERCRLFADNTIATALPQKIVKNDDVMRRLLAFERISPTAIGKYLRCPLRFYYYHIAGMKDDTGDEDGTIDQRMFGNILHDAARRVYELITSDDDTVTTQDIDRMLGDERTVYEAVEAAMNEELYGKQSMPKHHRYSGLQLLDKSVISHYIMRLLRYDRIRAPFRILGLEKSVEKDISFVASERTICLKISGIIDRLDAVSCSDGKGETLRVIDYKTGIAPSSCSLKDLKAVFDGANVSKKHSDYFLQTMLYAAIVDEDETLNAEKNNVSPCLLFIRKISNEGYEPSLRFGNKTIDSIADYKEEFLSLLKDTLAEIYDPQKAFEPTNDAASCTDCPYRSVCEI